MPEEPPPPEIVASVDVIGRQTGSKGICGFGYYSIKKLVEAEANLLASVAHRIVRRFVPVRFKNGEVFTISVSPAEEHGDNVPVVLVHGFGAGSAIWCGNIAALARKHQLHALDLLGFARSSRPAFSNDETLAELEMVEALEDWRKEMNFEKMYLVAHSFGGYLASSYTLEHPSRVKHLILVDPWGFPEKPPPSDKQVQPYPWMHMVGNVLSYFNPFAVLRAAGPYGPALVKKLRPDLSRRYNANGQISDDIYNYIYHCNAQSPTGEAAFKVMTQKFGWAKRPMIRRFGGISETVPVTFIYGSKSWIDPGPAFDIQTQRRSYVDVQIIRGAGHHVYADAPDAFNEIVCKILDDEGNETDSTTKELFSETEDDSHLQKADLDSDSTLHKASFH